MADYINREVLKKNNIAIAASTEPFNIASVFTIINRQIAADVLPVIHAHWIRCPDCGVTKCSNCGWSIEEYWYSDYCPSCDAKMDEKKNT